MDRGQLPRARYGSWLPIPRSGSGGIPATCGRCPMSELKTLTRRDCLIAASAVAVASRQTFARGATIPPITVTPDPARPSIPASVRVVGDDYVWSWTAATDVFRIEDRAGRVIATSELQPAVAAHVGGETTDRPGRL